jgi:hypothetical protein
MRIDIVSPPVAALASVAIANFLGDVRPIRSSQSLNGREELGIISEREFGLGRNGTWILASRNVRGNGH